MSTVSKEQFVNSLQSFVNVLAKKGSGLAIDENLTIVQKSGWRWRLLCLLQPFYKLFGKDLFSHVRANRVAQQILRFCVANKAHLAANPKLFCTVQTEIISRLDQKTAYKYYYAINAVESQLRMIMPPPPPHRRPTRVFTPASKDFASLIQEMQTRIASKNTRLPQPKGNNFSPSCSQVIPGKAKWYWPSNLKDLQITEAQKEAYDSVFSEVLSSLQTHSVVSRKNNSIENGVKTTQFTIQLVNNSNASTPVKEFQVQHVFMPYKDFNGSFSDLIFLSKRVLGKGGERTVKLSYSIITGDYYARKNCTSLVEANILKFFNQFPSRGLVPIKGIQFKASSKGPRKIQVMETLCKGSLNILFNTQPLSEAKTTYSLIGDLLHGMHFLHSQKVDGYEFRNKNGFGEIEKYTINQIAAFHLDLSPGNILVWQDGKTGEWKAGISDFGSCTQLTYLGGTYGFRSPEAIEFEVRETRKSFIPNLDIAKHNLNNGQPRDIWSMGLILCCILARQTKKVNGVTTAPIPCIEKCFFNIPKPIADAEMAKLKQADLDRDIAQLKAKTWNPLLAQLWDLVGLMLKVDPKQRINAKSLLDKYTRIEFPS